MAYKDLLTVCQHFFITSTSIFCPHVKIGIGGHPKTQGEFKIKTII